MSPPEITSTTCAFIPVYCYYHEAQGEVKSPILIMDEETFLLKAIILKIDPSIFSEDELKDQFIDAYYDLMHEQQRQENCLNAYDIYPQQVTILHTDDAEISIYVCELYENSEHYFQQSAKSSLTEPISYKQGIDELIKGGALEPLTEKILVALSEEDYITARNQDNNSSSIELF